MLYSPTIYSPTIHSPRSVTPRFILPKIHYPTIHSPRSITARVILPKSQRFTILRFIFLRLQPQTHLSRLFPEDQICSEYGIFYFYYALVFFIVVHRTREALNYYKLLFDIARTYFIEKKKSMQNLAPSWSYSLISPIISGLFNSCFKKGNFANVLKIVEVVPIFKKDYTKYHQYLCYGTSAKFLKN